MYCSEHNCSEGSFLDVAAADHDCLLILGMFRKKSIYTASLPGLQGVSGEISVPEAVTPFQWKSLRVSQKRQGSELVACAQGLVLGYPAALLAEGSRA